MSTCGFGGIALGASVVGCCCWPPPGRSVVVIWAEAGADATVVHTRANTNAAALTMHFIADILVSVG